MNTNMDMSNMERSCFLAKISHEIRTPLNGIIGMTSIAKHNSCTSEEMMEYLDKIDISAQYLLAIVNDLFDLSELESGGMKVEKKPFSLMELSKNVEVLMRQQMQNKNVNFVIEHEISNGHVIGDMQKLQQVMVHLLENAENFTKQNGEVVLRIREKENEEDCEIYIEVQDTGAGIREENVEHLFELFEKQEKRIVAKYGKSGLGLSIAKNLVELMGGKLVVSSVYGEGSTFSFCLCLPKIKVDRSREDGFQGNAMPDFHGYRMLVVEDNSINMEITQTILEMAGFEVDCAVNGKEALEMYEKSEDDYYDGIIMDIQMPVMDGLEATRRIRSLGREDGKHVPIIAVSANAYDKDMREALACGIDEYVAKPIDVNKLYMVLKKRLEKNAD